ncbi:MAG: N-acetylglucosamine-6-phosphate deacetylase, partial [Gammaproteobacteria bacterium]|nr:N-acetylglucosamine-6-phosphate deacetylase [Gammaproteobacteria bacterium]
MAELNRCIFSGMSILLGQNWQHHHAVVVENGVIKAILHEEMIQHHLPAKQYSFSKQHYLIPGLIDLHIHGAEDNDVMDGNVEALLSISRVLVAEGVTGFLATTMAMENSYLEEVLKTIAAAIPSREGAAILGVHLEGPFIATAKMGAQRGEYCQPPDLILFQRLQDAAEGAIKLVTLAPELPGALSMVESLHSMDIIASVGHTNATYAETCAAIDVGCSHATHLFNAMRGLHQREPGAVGALLLSRDVYAELIVDGVHLHP